MGKAKSVFFVLFLILFVAIIVCIVMDAIIPGAILFTITFILGFVFISAKDKKAAEEVEKEFSAFFDSHVKASADETILETEMRSYAPIINDEEFVRTGSWELVYKGRKIYLHSIGFGKMVDDWTNKVDENGDRAQRYESTSGFMVMKTNLKRAYPLIKVRCKDMKFGGCDEKEILSFEDPALDDRYIVSTEDPERASKTDAMNKIAAYLKEHTDFTMAFSTWERELYVFLVCDGKYTDLVKVLANMTNDVAEAL